MGTAVSQLLPAPRLDLGRFMSSETPLLHFLEEIRSSFVFQALTDPE